MNDNKSKIIKIYAMTAFSLLALIICAMSGDEFKWPTEIMNEETAHTIFFRIRLPRTLLAFIAGGALSLSGMVFQAVFRNPIASPFTLGVASGASFGATIYIVAGLPLMVAGISLTTVFSFLGAMLSVSIVYFISRLYKKFDSTIMILSGVIVSFFFSSFILFLQYTTDFTNSFKITRWTMGALDTVGYDSVLNTIFFLAAGFAIIRYYVHDLNLISIDEELSVSRGVEVTKVKKRLFISTSMMIGAVVAFTGPIGFVGIIAPHISRAIIGENHRYLSVLSLLCGGTLLVICDTISRMIMFPVELPVGVITSLLGGPFFLWLLYLNSRRAMNN